MNEQKTTSLLHSPKDTEGLSVNCGPDESQGAVAIRRFAVAAIGGTAALRSIPSCRRETREQSPTQGP
jgi:hypothetical protein